jgi:hypothetical protein
MEQRARPVPAAASAESGTDSSLHPCAFVASRLALHEVAEASGVRCHLATRATLIACEEPRFLEGCRAANIRVVGAEGFDLIDTSIRPDMEAILDLGDLIDPSGSVEDAIRFVDAVYRPGLMLEFQLERT